MTTNHYEALEAISSELSAVISKFNDLSTEVDGLVPFADDVWALNSQVEEFQNNVYGVWSEVSEKRESGDYTTSESEFG